MSVDMNVPEIRFNGFSGEWEPKTLGHSVSYIKGFAFKSKDYEGNGTRIVRVSDLTQNSLSESSSKIYISSSKANLYSNYMINDGDIVITTVGSKAEMRDSAVGRAIIFTKSEGHLLNQNLVKVTPTITNDSQFVYNQLLREQYAKFIEDIQRGNANQANIAIGDLWEYSLNFPRIKKEQIQIGQTFEKLDNLTNQHQQKHDKLSSIKKAMLEKMFPKQGETIPEIRFKGFSGEWEKKSFGTCFDNVPNNTLSRAELNYHAGLAKNIHYGDVLIKFGEVLDVRKEVLPFITSDEVINKVKHAALKNGDIVIADAAEDSTVGKCTELYNVGGQIVLSGLHTIAVRPTLSFAAKYLGYYLNSLSYHDQLLSLMQGTKVLSISKTAIQNTNVVFPNDYEEQAAIGSYFQQLDALIEQHQQQITKLNNIKQACLKKMFV